VSLALGPNEIEGSADFCTPIEVKGPDSQCVDRQCHFAKVAGNAALCVSMGAEHLEAVVVHFEQLIAKDAPTCST
jgi:hypothetical protein